MDLKVSIDDVPREVCGVTETTTCEEIIFKLAQVASVPGFYTLVVKIADKEVTLSPDERILQFIRSTKENPKKLCFILRRLEATSPFPHKQRNPPYSNAPVNTAGRSNTQYPHTPHRSSREADTRLHPRSQHKNVFVPTSSRHSAKYETNATLPEPNSNASDSTCQDTDPYNQLKDQLAYQEQQVELNRIRLLRLDKEIAQLEQAARSEAKIGGQNELLSGSAVGPVAELAQLAATPWTQLLEHNRARHCELVAECERHKKAIESVENQLIQANKNINDTETHLSQELNRLLVELETYNQLRRQILKTFNPNASSSSQYPRTHHHTSGLIDHDGGVPI